MNLLCSTNTKKKSLELTFGMISSREHDENLSLLGCSPLTAFRYITKWFEIIHFPIVSVSTYYNFLQHHRAHNVQHQHYHDLLPNCAQVHVLLLTLLQLIKSVSSNLMLSSELNIIKY